MGLDIQKPNVVGWIYDRVIEPAVDAASPLVKNDRCLVYSDASSGLSHPLIVAFGEPYERVLDARAKRLLSIDEGFAELTGGKVAGARWPKGRGGGYVCRRFRVYKHRAFDETDFYALTIVVGQQGPPPPSSEFDDIVKGLLSGWLPDGPSAKPSSAH